MCSVRIGQTLFGIPITHILEIVGDTTPQNVPLAPEFVGGLVHYRGDVLTTVSLRQLLGMPTQNSGSKPARKAATSSWSSKAPPAASACWSIRSAKC